MSETGQDSAPRQPVPARPLPLGSSGSATIRPTWADLARATLLVFGLLILAAIAWALIDVMLLIFAAVVVATVLRALAELIERVMPLPSAVALAIACLIIVALISVFVMLLGTQLSGQFTTLSQQLPEQLAALGERFGVKDLADRAEDAIEGYAGDTGVIQSIAGFTSGLATAAANGLLVLVAAIYLAMRPGLYRRGCLILFPPRVREHVADATENAGRALKLWLAGQLLAMVIVGVMTGVGLSLLGSPSPLALGFIAGIAEFVPVVGPILSAVPALLLAIPQGGAQVLWILALYVLVQQVESNLIMPLVQRRTVDLPPALTLFALLAFGVLFGPLGVLLATPLTVVSYVAVKQLYLRDTLKEPVAVPGADPESGGPPASSP